MSTRKSLVPGANEFHSAILEYASKRGRAFHRREAMEAMAKHFKLSPAAKSELTREGHAFRYENRTSRAISDLKNYGELLRRVAPGCYEITEKGKQELASGRASLSYLQKKYPRHSQRRG